ncbi:MAG: hypothetical protein ACI9ND_000185 [Yoonia sp.]|jgi:hypothetical protein
MYRRTIVISCLASATVLSACSGGSGSGEGGTNIAAQTLPDYVAFTNSSSAVDSSLGGQSIDTDTNTITAVIGTLTHNTRALTGFTASGVTLSDMDGDTAGTWSDDSTTLSPTPLEVADYGFAGFYQMQNAGTSASIVVGAVTRTADVPTTGKVTYAGDALLQGASINGAMTAQGNSAVEVDLATRIAEITIDGVGGIGYDSAVISGVDISTDRTGLSGGTLQLLKSDADVTPLLLGPSPTHTLAADFFGLDSDKNPDEVGGVFHTSGSNGALSGSFLAD